MKRKNNIVVTGALGQDGIILSQILVKKKYNVHGILKKNKKSNFKLKKVIYRSLDLSNFEQLKNNLDKINPSCLIHLGSENPNFYELKKKKFYDNNYLITKNLIDYFSKNKPNKKLIIIGSSQMYRSNIKRIDLKTNFKPINSYAKFRADSFNYMVKSKKKYRSNIVMAVLFNHDSIYRNKKFLIPRLVKMVKNKQYKKLNEIFKVNIIGDFSHAEDICCGLFKLISIKKNIDKLIFSSNKKTSINDVIKFLLKKNKIKKNFKLKIFRAQESSIGDNTYTKKLLNWKLKKNIFKAADELNKSI